LNHDAIQRTNLRHRAADGQCAFTGRTLAPGESYMATLIEVDPALLTPDGGANAKTAANTAAGVWI